MSKVIPVKEPKYYASRRHEHAEVCPRLEKWMEKANSGGFVSKRPKKSECFCALMFRLLISVSVNNCR